MTDIEQLIFRKFWVSFLCKSALLFNMYVSHITC